MSEMEHISGVIARVEARMKENQQLRVRLRELNARPLTPELQKERASIIRRLGGSEA